MGFYRLIRMIFRDILFKIPKKYLVIIIMILLIFIFKNSVSAVSVEPENVEIHEWIDITSYYDSNRIDTQIIPTSENNLYLIARLSLSNKSWVNILQCGTSFAFYSGNVTASDTKTMNCEINRNVVPGTISFLNDTKNTFAFLFQDDNIIQVNNVEMTRYSGVEMNNTTNHLFLQYNNPGATTFYFYELKNEYSVNGDILNYIVPGVYNNQKVLYDLITHEIVATLSNDVAIGGVIENPNPDTPEEPTTPDYSEDFTQVNENLDNINNSINETNENLEDINNSINNTDVSNSVVLQPDMPQDTSGVKNGVDNIFTIIMDAFVNLDTTQNVILPIPFTDKTITIPGTYTRDMLTSVNATWILTFINLIWWYLISRYIIKDILKMVDKIQEGNLDKVESSNIKGDML